MPELPPLPEDLTLADNAFQDSDLNMNNIKTLDVESKESKSALNDLFGDVFITHIVPGKSVWERVESEVLNYKAEPLPPISSNPLLWWKCNEEKYPLLSILAKYLLGVPATSVASERVFSTAGDVVTSQRACLSPENV